MMMMGRPGNRPGARPGGGGFMGMGMPVEKSKDFRGTFRRLVARLRPERALSPRARGSDEHRGIGAEQQQ